MLPNNLMCLKGISLAFEAQCRSQPQNRVPTVTLAPLALTVTPVAVASRWLRFGEQLSWTPLFMCSFSWRGPNLFSTLVPNATRDLQSVNTSTARWQSGWQFPQLSDGRARSYIRESETPFTASKLLRSDEVMQALPFEPAAQK
jgi:hypothetical protein